MPKHAAAAGNFAHFFWLGHWLIGHCRWDKRTCPDHPRAPLVHQQRPRIRRSTVSKGPLGFDGIAKSCDEAVQTKACCSSNRPVFEKSTFLPAFRHLPSAPKSHWLFNSNIPRHGGGFATAPQHLVYATFASPVNPHSRIHVKNLKHSQKQSS
jgi:hypothetical protein